MNQRPPHAPHEPSVLDAEERALAKALPRLHGRTAPGPDLDASILAAAESAVRPARLATSPARPRVRWIAPAALAASMVLAVGMAWQLRPLPALQVAQPAAQPAADSTLSVQMIEPAPSDQPILKMQSEPAPVPLPTIAPAREQGTSPSVIAQEAAPAPREMPVEVSAAPVYLPAPPAPPPPPALATSTGESASRDASPVMTQESQSSGRAMAARAAAPTAAGNAIHDGFLRDAAPAVADKAGGANSARQAASKAAQPAQVSPEVRNEAEMAADAGFVDDPGVDIPPATAASPAVRDAWLHRIGELLEQGKRQDAKTSLAEFRRRYPTAALPPALRALEIEP